MTNINNQANLESWIGGDIGILTANITLTDDTAYPLSLANNSTLDGNGYTITLMSGNTNGIFSFFESGITATIKNLKVNADSISTFASGKGAIISQINQASTNLTLRDCAVIGSYNTGDQSGCIVGGTDSLLTNNIITIDSCYSTGTMLGSESGGIMGYRAGSGGTIVISDCYSTGDITGGSAGGIAGGAFGITATGTPTINNCYSIGNVSGANAGGIAGRYAGEGGIAFLIKNCYHSGSIVGDGAGSIAGRLSNSAGTISNCYSKNATDVTIAGRFVGSASTTTISSSCDVGSGTFSPTLGTDLLDNFDSYTDIWVSSGGFTSGYGLTEFNQAPWDIDTSYTSNTSEAVFSAPGGGGDPHIVTIHGEKYYLESGDWFNLFDNCNKDDRFVVNSSIKHMKYPTWDKMEYMNHIFIFYNNRNCVIDVGFRGDECKVISNNGNFTIKKHKLSLTDKATKFCKECKFRTPWCKTGRQHADITKHKLLDNVRNRIIVTVNTKNNKYDIHIENVNRNNFNPSSVIMRMDKNNNIDEYDGAIIYQSNHDIPCLNHINNLR